MDESLSQTVRSSDHIEVMQDLLKEILHIQKENTDVDKGMQRVQEIIVESSKVVENSTSTNEMIVDAKILHTGTSVVNTNVSSLNTNLTTFSEPKYINGVQYFMENSDHIVLVGKEWECLAPVTYKMFRKSHPVTFMLGPFTLDPLESKEKIKDKQKKELEPEKTCLTTILQKNKFAEEGRDVYDHILKWLVRHYKRNERQPINYFNFIIDPTDYWKTVENIFHFAFLVRDGSVKMSIDDGLPFVEPVLRNPNEKAPPPQNNNYQFCLSLGKVEWRKCIQKFSIVTASIPPFPN